MQNTFRVAGPENVQALAGAAPFGYPVGYDPPLSRPVIVPSGTQPNYVLKIDVTPIGDTTKAGTPVQYDVVAPTEKKGISEQSQLKSQLIAHVLPKAISVAKNAEKSKLTESSLDTPRTQQILVQPIPPTTQSPAAYIGVYPQGRFGQTLDPATLIEVSRGFEGATESSTEGSFGQKVVNFFSSALGKTTPELSAAMESGGPSAAFSAASAASVASSGPGRQLSQQMGEFEEDSPKIYNWISPAGKKIQFGETIVPLEAPEKESEGKDKKETTKEKQARKKKAKKALPWWSRICGGPPGVSEWEKEEDELKVLQKGLEDEEEEEEEEVQSVSEESETESEPEDGIKPKVLYGGTDVSDPLYCGKKKPINWVLSSIQVHQYLPCKGHQVPPIISNSIDPGAQSIFGAVPLPFSPEETGMIAPSLQGAIDGELRPKLPPLMRQLFNQYIPLGADGQ